MNEYIVSVQGVWLRITPDIAKTYVLKTGTAIKLIPEPSNPYDKNAVKVVRSDTRKFLGYIPKEQAKILSPALQKNTPYDSHVIEYKVTSRGKYKNQASINIVIKIGAALQKKITEPPMPSSAKGRSGVYSIRNMKNGKTYVGSSVDIGKRWEQHIRQLNSNLHSNFKLQHDWNQFGSGVFKFEILETTKTQLESLEAKWIRSLNSHYSGYNTTSDGKAGRGAGWKYQKDKSNSFADTIVTPPPKQKSKLQIEFSNDWILIGAITAFILLVNWVA